MGFILFSLNIFAQPISSNFISESKANKLEETKGLFLKVQRFESTYFYGGATLRMTPVIITNIRTDEKEGYVEFWFSTDGGYKSSLDYDEIPACLEALDYITKNELPNKPSTEEHVFFKTRDGIHLGAYYEMDGKRSKWYTSLRQTKYISNPQTIYEINLLDKIIMELKREEELIRSNM